MGFDPVPWLTGGGAEHTAEVGRVLAYACSDGGEGVIKSNSLRVRARAVPDNQIAVDPGAAIIHNNSLLPTSAYEAYAVRAPTATLVAINPTSSAGGRSDLVIARVEDPQYAPWAYPTNPVVGPYVFARVIENVPVGTTDVRDLDPSFAINYPAITLARIDVPVSTATIQNAHIFDLREIANPRLVQANRVFQSPTRYGVGGVTTSTAFKNWPYTWTHRIPKWATHMSMRTLYNVQAQYDKFVGHLRMTVVFGATTITSKESAVDTVFTSTVESREVLMLADEMAIPGSMRGKLSTFNLQIKKGAGGVYNGELNIDSLGMVASDILFSEVAE